MVKPDALRVIFTEYLKYLAAVARGVVPPAHERVRRPDRGQRRGDRRAH